MFGSGRAQRLTGQEFENVEFRYGQAEKIPVDDSTIDVIISNCVINLREDKGLVFQEAFRVVKPGGRLEVSDMVTGGPLPLEIRRNNNEWAGCVSGALPETEYLDLIAQAGFTGIASRKSTKLRRDAWRSGLQCNRLSA